MGYTDVVKREFKRYRKNHLSLFISFFFPLIMCILICLIFGKATPQDLPIGILNSDNSKISRLIVRDINSLSSCKIKYQLNDFKEGKNLLIEGKIYGFIVIPKNFERDIYRMQQPKLVFYYNNQRILIGGIISKDITTVIQSMIVGLDAKIKSKNGLPFEEAVKQSNLINVADHIMSNPYFNYLYLLSLTAFGHIMQISIVMTSAFAVGEEFKYGTTKEWLKEADNSIFIAILGKLTPYFIVFSALFAIIFFVYFGLYQAPYYGNILVGIFGTSIFIIACLFLSVLFMSINGNFRFGASGAAFFTAIGFALAGVTFPVIAMPKIIQIYASIMPLYYWTQIILDQSIRNISYIYDLKLFIPLLIMILIDLMALLRLKKLALDEKRWHQQ